MSAERRQSPIQVVTATGVEQLRSKYFPRCPAAGIHKTDQNVCSPDARPTVLQIVHVARSCGSLQQQQEHSVTATRQPRRHGLALSPVPSHILSLSLSPGRVVPRCIARQPLSRDAENQLDSISDVVRQSGNRLESDFASPQFSELGLKLGLLDLHSVPWDQCLNCRKAGGDSTVFSVL